MSGDKGKRCGQGGGALGFGRGVGCENVFAAGIVSARDAAWDRYGLKGSDKEMAHV